jgi:sugar-specific transcriptional regulator TrmB
VDLTPFGFTPTESRLYSTLLGLGPSTGYAAASAAGLARANAYAALEGLVRRGAALRTAGRPGRYRATAPQALLIQLAADQGERLERLSQALADIRQPVEPITRVLEGARAVATVVQQIVARAERAVDGVLAAELWQSTLPAWRRASARATLQVRIAGDPGDTQGLAFPSAPADHPTLLLVDGVHTLTAATREGAMLGLWSSHPLIAGVARMAIGAG